MINRIGIIIALGALLSSCEEECKTCYVVEGDGNGGVYAEYEIGEFCGDEIEEKENEELYCIQGNCYNVCR